MVIIVDEDHDRRLVRRQHHQYASHYHICRCRVVLTMCTHCFLVRTACAIASGGHDFFLSDVSASSHAAISHN